MSTTIAAAPVRTEAGSAGRAVTALVVRQLGRGALLVAAVVGVLPALVVVQYRDTFSGHFDVASLQALATNPAVRTLFGPPVALDDPGGFTVWRTGAFTSVLVAAWAMLAVLRTTRGEEDAGRWALLLSGALTRRQVLVHALLVAAGAQVLVGAALAGGLLLAGARAPGALLHGAGTALVGAVFAAVGAACAQLLPERRAAAGAGGGLLAVAVMARMVADGADGLGWLRWVSPFGVQAEVRPFADDDARPLLVLVAMAAAAAAAALVAVERRDLGAGLLRVRDSRAARLRLLRSVPAFALRRSLRSWAVWAAGIGAYYLLIGLLSVSVTEFLTQNPRFAAAAGEAGFGALGSAEGYVAATYALLAVPVGLYAAGRIAADAADEAAGRFVLLLSLPVSRRRWLAAHVAVLALAVTALALVAGLAAWAGARTAGAELALGGALGGALNTVPVALVALGAAVLALGIAPRAVAAVGALPVVGGFLLLVLADSFGWPEVVRSLSPFAHVATVPVVGWDAAGAAGLVAAAAALALAGAWALARRDLRC